MTDPARAAFAASKAARRSGSLPSEVLAVEAAAGFGSVS